MNLGITIKKIRQQKGQSQIEFASIVGITQTYLSQIENDIREPNLSTLKKISTHLALPLPILFFLALSETDIPVEKRQAFEIINPSINIFVNEFFGVSK